MPVALQGRNLDRHYPTTVMEAGEAPAYDPLPITKNSLWVPRSRWFIQMMSRCKKTNCQSRIVGVLFPYRGSVLDTRRSSPRGCETAEF